jgi:DNA-binding NarL/FixJ family response regulator
MIIPSTGSWYAIRWNHVARVSAGAVAVRRMRSHSPGPAAGKRVADRALTARELEVISALTRGKSNKEIGTLLEISDATVKVDITHILEKLKITGRTEAIDVAMRRGSVHIDPPAVA